MASVDGPLDAYCPKQKGPSLILPFILSNASTSELPFRKVVYDIDIYIVNPHRAIHPTRGFLLE